MNNNVKKIISNINSLSGEYTQHQVFTDWVCLMALSIANSCTMFHDAEYKARETKWHQVVNKNGVAVASQKRKSLRCGNYLIRKMTKTEDAGAFS